MSNGVGGISSYFLQIKVQDSQVLEALISAICHAGQLVTQLVFGIHTGISFLL
jgi:hypothetical protein